MPDIVFRWDGWGRRALDIRDLRREPVALQIVAHRHWRGYVLGYGRMSRETWALVVVVVRLRRGRLWWAGTRSVYALRRPGTAVARLLYSGRATRAGCRGSRRCCGRRDSDDIASTGIAIGLSPHILMARTTLESLLRVLRGREGVLILPVRWCDMSGRCLVVRGRMVVLFTGDRTSLVREAWICAAALATEIRRVGILAGPVLFFLLVSVIKTIFRCLLFGREWIGHAPFRSLFLLGGRHILGTRHRLRGVGCWLTT